MALSLAKCTEVAVHYTVSNKEVSKERTSKREGGSSNTPSVLTSHAVPKDQAWGIAKLNREAVSLPYDK